MFHSLLLEKTQNNFIYKENQILNLFLLMLNLQQDLRQKQTQQEEESGKLSAVTGVWIVMDKLFSLMQWEKASQLIVQEQLVVILIMLGGVFQNKTERIFIKV